MSANTGHARKMASYFNTEDYALGWWETNNESKPELDWNYWHTEGDHNVDSYFPAVGDRFYYNSLQPLDERTLTIPDDRFEIFARIVERGPGPWGGNLPCPASGLRKTLRIGDMARNTIPTAGSSVRTSPLKRRSGAACLRIASSLNNRRHHESTDLFLYPFMFVYSRCSPGDGGKRTGHSATNSR